MNKTFFSSPSVLISTLLALKVGLLHFIKQQLTEFLYKLTLLEPLNKITCLRYRVEIVLRC